MTMTSRLKTPLASPALLCACTQPLDADESSTFTITTPPHFHRIRQDDDDDVENNTLRSNLQMMQQGASPFTVPSTAHHRRQGSSSSSAASSLRVTTTTPPPPPPSVEQLRRAPSGSVSPSSISVLSRRYKPALVTQDYDFAQARPELESMLRGRPLKLPPSRQSSSVSDDAEMQYYHKVYDEEKKADTPDRVPRKRPQYTAAPSAANSPAGPPAIDPAHSTTFEDIDLNDDDNDKRANGHKRQDAISPASDVPQKQQQQPPSTLWAQEPPPLRTSAWSEAAAGDFKVRGATYLKDHVKVISAPAALELFCVDLMQVPINSATAIGVSQRSGERIQRALQRQRANPQQQPPQLPALVFCVNLVLPTTGDYCYSFGAYFGTNNVAELTDTSKPFGRLANRFFYGNDDAFCNRVFKLIPRVAEGNFVVRTAVGGSKPTLLGRKLKQRILRTRTANHQCVEILVDISSNPVASRIVKLALGYAKTLAVDLMFLLEGDDANTLPERLLGGVRIQNVDFGPGRDGQRRAS